MTQNMSTTSAANSTSSPQRNSAGSRAVVQFALASETSPELPPSRASTTYETISNSLLLEPKPTKSEEFVKEDEEVRHVLSGQPETLFSPRCNSPLAGSPSNKSSKSGKKRFHGRYSPFRRPDAKLYHNGDKSTAQTADSDGDHEIHVPKRGFKDSPYHNSSTTHTQLSSSALLQFSLDLEDALLPNDGSEVPERPKTPLGQSSNSVRIPVARRLCGSPPLAANLSHQAQQFGPASSKSPHISSWERKHSKDLVNKAITQTRRGSPSHRDLARVQTQDRKPICDGIYVPSMKLNDVAQRSHAHGRLPGSGSQLIPPTDGSEEDFLVPQEANDEGTQQ